MGDAVDRSPPLRVRPFLRGAGETVPEWLQSTPTSTSCVRVAAPMVRYSTLPFRLFLRRHGADLTFTPMMIASSFARAQGCRDYFSTAEEDCPVVAQFAAKDPVDMAECARLLAGHVDGIDLK
jgi:tRNA-dihydrouridine synthase 4